MARICDRCGKGNLQGRQVSFSGKRSPKVFKANLHFAWVIEGGRKVRRKFCTKCLRIVKRGLLGNQAVGTLGNKQSTAPVAQ